MHLRRVMRIPNNFPSSALLPPKRREGKDFLFFKKRGLVSSSELLTRNKTGFVYLLLRKLPLFSQEQQRVPSPFECLGNFSCLCFRNR
ncbi:hypothetical protein CEXT_99181 [Caerostris extrusa]|uniref:Uncharacterized protein n=1 Tax=Caerostris extrusa TaxID=172846 RepID=A0AAV4P0G9_CAEEX|nr:hypothetical protein CEXT_99181 [Caerostris extrusa]